MWGIVPAAGNGTRIQPLAFSKELLPVGSRRDEAGTERPRAVAEYLLDRMIAGGVDKICFVIGPDKSDIPRYFGGDYAGAALAYTVQSEASGLCDAIFRACPVVGREDYVIVGLPDTVWFPVDALAHLPRDRLGFLLFPVDRPEFFDSVVVDAAGRVQRIDVKSPAASSRWIWGAFGMPGQMLHRLAALWRERERKDVYIGTLINAFLEQGGEAYGMRAGQAYIDVGTLHGWHQAQALLGARATALSSPSAAFDRRQRHA